MLSLIILIIIAISIICLVKNKSTLSASFFCLASLLMLVLIVDGLSLKLEPKNQELISLDKKITLYTHELGQDNISESTRKKIRLALHEAIYQYNKKEKELLQSKDKN